MSDFYTEADYEKSVIELFQNMDYRYVYAPDLERDFRSPLYEEELDESIRRINPNMPEDAITDALYKLKNFENAELVLKNALFMDYIQHGIEVRYFVKGEERSGLVYLVDYKNSDNNSFVVANQWTFVENSNKRPDILLFLNGMPVVLVELKSPSREETDASEAYTQIRNYMHEIPSMFIYNCICVMSDHLTSKAGTITSGEDRFMEWKTKDGNYENTQYAQFDTFFEGMFEKERLLDIIKNFICFSNEGSKQIKILAGYHQYFAVNKAILSTKHAIETDGKGGVFWHTQGSGKSLSMVFYAHCLQDALDSPTIVVITDRNDLDDQLYGQFAKCSKFLRQEPVHADKRKLSDEDKERNAHLRKGEKPIMGLMDWLNARKANGIIFTTMQKFEESFECLSERRNIIVMADEAHRGQYGLKENLQRSSVKDVTKNVLLSWGILKKDDNEKIYPTNAYVYLTGQGGLRSMIQCAVFKGTTRSVFLDRRNYEGPLWEQVDEAVRFVLRNIRMGCRLEGVYRQDIYELPPDSIRELIVNAVMNCSYIQVSNIQVAIYDDRLEITSPGGLLPGVTIDLMKEGFSKIRNRALANAFAYMNLMEAWGSGIPKLMQAMQEYGLREPEFIDMEVAFRINLYRGQNEVIEVKNSNRDLDGLNKDLDDLNKDPDDLDKDPNDLDKDPNDFKNDLEIRLSELIRKNPELTYKALGEALAVSTATIKRTLTKMQRGGKVVREGSNRKGKWILTDKMK